MLFTSAAALPAAALVRRRVDAPPVLSPPALLPVRGNATLGAPVGVLYVSRRCGHCGPVAARFDSAAAALRVRAIIVAAEPPDSGRAVSRWATALGVRAALALDPNGALARALAIRAVPAFIAISRGSIVARYDVQTTAAFMIALRMVAR